MSLGVGQVMGRIVLCSLAAGAAVALLLGVYDLAAGRVLREMFSILSSANPSSGMGVAFHVIAIMIGLYISALAGSVAGLLWASLTAPATARTKLRAAFLWISLLAFVVITHISLEYRQ